MRKRSGMRSNACPQIMIKNKYSFRIVENIDPESATRTKTIDWLLFQNSSGIA